MDSYNKAENKFVSFAATKSDGNKSLCTHDSVLQSLHAFPGEMDSVITPVCLIRAYDMLGCKIFLQILIPRYLQTNCLECPDNMPLVM